MHRSVPCTAVGPLQEVRLGVALYSGIPNTDHFQ